MIGPLLVRRPSTRARAWRPRARAAARRRLAAVAGIAMTMGAWPRPSAEPTLTSAISRLIASRDGHRSNPSLAADVPAHIKWVP